MDIEYKIMKSTPENALYVERMRYKAYGVQKLIDPTEEDFMEDIIDGSFLVFLCLIEGKPASACYISNFNASLYVEYLFTLPEYQNRKLYLGKQLLQYILDNKEIVEEYFHQKFKKSSLCPGTNKIVPLYTSLGYQRERQDSVILSKKI